MEIHALQLGMIGTNCYVAHAAGSQRAVVVDPGDQANLVLELLERAGLEADAVLVTHCHWDHIGAVAPVAAATGADVYMSDTEAFVLEEEPNRFVPAGVGPFDACHVDVRLRGDERIEVAGLELQVLALPGHSPGSLGFLADGIRDSTGDGWDTPPVLFVGDLIFQGSVGRTDLPGASHDELLASCRMLFERLDDATVLLSGHGAATTIGAEKASNPFLRGLVTV